jgi:hypothetical protein
LCHIGPLIQKSLPYLLGNLVLFEQGRSMSPDLLRPAEISMPIIIDGHYY